MGFWNTQVTPPRVQRESRHAPGKATGDRPARLDRDRRDRTGGRDPSGFVHAARPRCRGRLRLPAEPLCSRCPVAMVEHPDPLQETADAPDPSGHATVDGATEAIDRASTQADKKLMAAKRTLLEDNVTKCRNSTGSSGDAAAKKRHHAGRSDASAYSSRGRRSGADDVASKRAWPLAPSMMERTISNITSGHRAPPGNAVRTSPCDAVSLMPAPIDIEPPTGNDRLSPSKDRWKSSWMPERDMAFEKTDPAAENVRHIKVEGDPMTRAHSHGHKLLRQGALRLFCLAVAGSLRNALSIKRMLANRLNAKFSDFLRIFFVKETAAAHW